VVRAVLVMVRVTATPTRGAARPGSVQLFGEPRGAAGVAHDPVVDVAVGLLDPAEVSAEAVLVEALAAVDVPQAAGVWADLVGQHDAAAGVSPELELEVDELEPE